MSYWKTKVLPKIQKIFGKDAIKKAAAAEACKTFDTSKEEVCKEFEDKKTQLQPKVLDIYEASETEIKELVKDPKETGLKKHSVKVQKFLDELVKIEFPGSKAVCEASSKYGPALVLGPVIFVFEKVSTFIVTEEKPGEIEVPTVEDYTTTAKETSEAAKEIVAVEEKPAIAATGTPAETKTDVPPAAVAASPAETKTVAPPAAVAAVETPAETKTAPPAEQKPKEEAAKPLPVEEPTKKDVPPTKA